MKLNDLRWPAAQTTHGEVTRLIFDRQWSSTNSRARRATNTIHTHIVLTGEHGGVLTIPDTDHGEFMVAYSRDIACGMRHFLREERTHIFRLAVDIDHKSKEQDKKWTPEQIQIWTRTFHTVLRKVYPNETNMETFMCIVTRRHFLPSYTQDSKDHSIMHLKGYKEGFRLSFPHLAVTTQTACTIRNCVLQELVSNGTDCRKLFQLQETDTIGEDIYRQLHDMVDESVYTASGFRMIGSAKIMESLCGKKSRDNRCSSCYTSFPSNKWDIGLVYQLWGVFPIRDPNEDDITYKDRRRVQYNQLLQLDKLIPACSVRIVPQPKQEHPGFVCTYDLTASFLVTQHGAQYISPYERKAMSRTKRRFDPAHVEDQPKFESFMQYLQTTSFPATFPYNQMQRNDIKSIQMDARSQKFQMFLCSRFCALKGGEHSGFESYFTLSSDGRTHSLVQGCHNATCQNSRSTVQRINRKRYYHMPPITDAMCRAFFPFHTPPSLVPVIPTSLSHAVVPEAVSELTMAAMVANAKSYFPVTTKAMLQQQVRGVSDVVYMLRSRLDAFREYRQTHATDPNPHTVVNPVELITEYQSKQGTSNQIFRPIRGRGRGAGTNRHARGGGGRGGQSNQRDSNRDDNNDWEF